MHEEKNVSNESIRQNANKLYKKYLGKYMNGNYFICIPYVWMDKYNRFGDIAKGEE